MTTFYDHNQLPYEKPEDAPVVWRMSGYGVLENEKGEWLMVQPTWVEKLDFPGGGIHCEETLLEGTAREFYEETGYRVHVHPVPLFIGENNFYYKCREEFCRAIMNVYRVTLADEKRDAHVVNTFEDGFEIADMRWVDPNTMTQEQVQPPVWQYLQFLQETK